MTPGKFKVAFSSYRISTHAKIKQSLNIEDIAFKDFLPMQPLNAEKPKDFTLREAEANGKMLLHRHESYSSLSISTAISCGTRILRNNSSEDLNEILRLLSGRRHRLISAISFFYKNNSQIYKKNIFLETIVKIKRLEEKDFSEIKQMLNSQPIFYLDNFLGSSYIDFIRGSYGNIEGHYNHELKIVRDLLKKL